jgi:hypothetical protein
MIHARNVPGSGPKPRPRHCDTGKPPDSEPADDITEVDGNIAGAVGESTKSMGLATSRSVAEGLPRRMLRGLRLAAPGDSLPHQPGRLRGRQLLDLVAVERFR